MGMGGQRQALATLFPGNRPNTHCRGEPHGRSGRVWKISPPPGLAPQNLSDRSGRYIDYSIPLGNKYEI